MSLPTIRGDIVKEYLSKWSNINTLTLARKIYKETPEAFTDAENVRDIIRYYRGAHGKKNRKAMKDIAFLRESGDEARSNPYGLPNSDEIQYIPFEIPRAQNNILILYDIHVPYHNIPACSAAIEYGVRKGVNTIILGGDFLDFHQLSNFIKDPRKRHFQEELQAGRDFLEALKAAFPDAVFYFMQGNHERRLETYLKVKAPELFDTADFELNIIMRFGEMGIQYIKDRRIVHAGKLNILHGDEFGQGATSAVNPARNLFLKAKESTMQGHNHQTSEHTEPKLNGDIITCWSCGCLCELNPDYRPLNKWNHGFAHVRINEDGSYRVHNARIYHGKVL
jgi:predicted phosphodiesterase